MATYARGLTSQAVNLTHTTHWSECLMYYVANACSNRNLCNWRVYITSAKGERRKASDWVGVNGRSRTLRGATVTDVHALPVGTVVCVHAKAMKESWCVVASEDKIRAGPRGLDRDRDLISGIF